jgi:hypothetical protein
VNAPRASALLICAVLALSTLAAPTLRAQDEGNRAALVVRGGDGDSREMCVFFTEDEITGAELLQRSNLDVVTEANALGSAVCRIDGTGCTRDDCFCNYPAFWGYWTRDDGKWAFSDIGASDRVVTNGSVDGWTFGKDGKPAPKDVAFDDVCGSVEAAPASATDDGVTRLVTPRSNYGAFAGFAVLIVTAAALALVIRRRRS